MLGKVQACARVREPLTCLVEIKNQRGKKKTPHHSGKKSTKNLYQQRLGYYNSMYVCESKKRKGNHLHKHTIHNTNWIRIDETKGGNYKN